MPMPLRFPSFPSSFGHVPRTAAGVVFTLGSLLGCGNAEPLCTAADVTLSLPAADALYWWAGDTTPSRTYAVTRTGDSVCRLEASSDTPGVSAHYDATAGELHVDFSETQTPAGRHAVELTLAGEDVSASLTLDLRYLPTPPDDATRHVLVLGVDGLRPDAIEPADAPVMDMLFAHGAGTLEATTQLTGDTVSGPGWASILTGVEVERHGVTSNETAVMEAIDRSVPTLLGAAFDEGLATGLIVHWLQLPLLVEDGPAQGFRLGDDAIVASTAVRFLGAPRDLLFLHFDDCDHAGHATGYGPENPDYIAAVEGVDRHFATVIDGVLARETYASEAWLFVLVTDHGGEGTAHGARNAINQTIPLLFVRPGMTPATLAGASHMDVAPTVLRYLGVDTGASYDGQVVDEALPAL
jgi:hypothetical protein